MFLCRSTLFPHQRIKGNFHCNPCSEIAHAPFFSCVENLVFEHSGFLFVSYRATSSSCSAASLASSTKVPGSTENVGVAVSSGFPNLCNTYIQRHKYIKLIENT